MEYGLLWKCKSGRSQWLIHKDWNISVLDPKWNTCSEPKLIHFIEYYLFCQCGIQTSLPRSVLDEKTYWHRIQITWSDQDPMLIRKDWKSHEMWRFKVACERDNYMSTIFFCNMRLELHEIRHTPIIKYCLLYSTSGISEILIPRTNTMYIDQFMVNFLFIHIPYLQCNMNSMNARYDSY